MVPKSCRPSRTTMRVGASHLFRPLHVVVILFPRTAAQVLMPSAVHTFEVPVTPLDVLGDVIVHVTVVFPDTEVGTPPVECRRPYFLRGGSGAEAHSSKEVFVQPTADRLFPSSPTPVPLLLASLLTFRQNIARSLLSQSRRMYVCTA